MLRMSRPFFKNCRITKLTFALSLAIKNKILIQTFKLQQQTPLD